MLWKNIIYFWYPVNTFSISDNIFYNSGCINVGISSDWGGSIGLVSRNEFVHNDGLSSTPLPCNTPKTHLQYWASNGVRLVSEYNNYINTGIKAFQSENSFDGDLDSDYDYFGTSSASGRYWSSTDNLSYANPSVENVLTQANQNDSFTKSQPRLLQDGYAKFKLDYAPDYELGHNILNYIIEISDGVNPPQIAEIQIFVDDIAD